jgi:hypothetical protein
VTTRTEQVQDKKKTLTGQRRNTIILKHLMFQSCDELNRGHNQKRLEQRLFLLFLDNLTISLGLLK